MAKNGLNMHPKVSCAGSLIPNVKVLESSKTLQRLDLIGGDWIKPSI